jgi:plasmid maintenance system killer protein
MELRFLTTRLEKEFSSEKGLKKAHGQERAKKIMTRMGQLSAADDLEQLRNAPGRCHVLKWNLRNTFSLDLDGPYRLLFESTVVPPPVCPDGSLDWAAIKSVCILEVRDTHE